MGKVPAASHSCRMLHMVRHALRASLVALSFFHAASRALCCDVYPADRCMFTAVPCRVLTCTQQLDSCACLDVLPGLDSIGGFGSFGTCCPLGFFDMAQVTFLSRVRFSWCPFLVYATRVGTHFCMSPVIRLKIAFAGHGRGKEPHDVRRVPVVVVLPSRNGAESPPNVGRCGR